MSFKQITNTINLTAFKQIKQKQKHRSWYDQSVCCWTSCLIHFRLMNEEQLENSTLTFLEHTKLV